MKRIYKIITLFICLWMAFPTHLYASEGESTTSEVYGIFGRSVDDASIKISGGETYEYEVKQIEPSEDKTDNILLNMYIAWDKDADKTISASFNYGDNITSENIELIKFSQNGSVSFGSSSVNGILLCSRWYKLSVLINRYGEASLYIDGYYIGYLEIDLSDINGITNITANSEEEMYIDDIDVSATENTEISPFSISHMDTEIGAGMVKSISEEIFISPYITVDEFMSGLETGGASVVVRGESGEEFSDDSSESVAGKYFVFENENTKPVYFKAETDTVDIKSTEAKQEKLNGKGFVWEKVKDGVGGRGSDEELYHIGQPKTSSQLISDGAFTVDDAKSWRDNGIIFKGLNINSKYAYYPTTFEGSFYYRGEDTKINLNTKLLNQSNAGFFSDVVNVYSNGDVFINGEKNTSITTEAWNYISFTVYPGESSKAVIRINGQLIDCVEFGQYLPKVESVKSYIEIAGGEQYSNQWGEMWMADWDVYVGTARNGQRFSNTLISSENENIEIDGDNITMRKGFTAGELIEAISASDSAEKAVISQNYPQNRISENAMIENGNKLIIIDKGIYKYYTLEYDADVLAIRFENYVDGQSVAVDSAEKLRVSAGNETVSMDLYIDNVLTESVSDVSFYEFDISSAGAGKHSICVYAEDAEGRSAENKIMLRLNEQITMVNFETDFQNYISGVPNGFGTYSLNKGYMESAELSADKGKSFVLGIDKDKMQFEDAQGAWIGLSTSAVQNFSIEFDAYFDNVTGCSIDLKKEGISPTTSLYIADGNISLQKNGTILLAYTDKTWYRIKFDFKTASKTYNVSIWDSEGICVGNAENVSISQDYDSIDWIRFCGPNDENRKSVFGIDNVRYSTNYDATQINSVGYDDVNEEPIDFMCEKINAYVSGNLKKDSVGKDSVKLFDGDTEIDLSDISYDIEKNIVSVKTNEKLKSNTEYTLKFTDSMKDENGASLQTVYSFKTKRNSIEFENCMINGNEFSAKTVNISDKTQTAYIIIKVSKGNEIVSEKVYKHIVYPGTNSFSYPVVKASDEEKVSVYIWSSLKFPQSYISYDIQE